MNPNERPVSYRGPLERAAIQLKESPETREDREDVWVRLLERTAGGDTDALARIYDGTASLVYGLALRIVGDAGNAEEVTEDVFLQVWRQAARYDASRSGAVHWLLTLARSRAIDRLRAGASSRSRHAPLEDAGEVHDAAPGPEHAAVAGERRTLVRNALARLSRDQRQAVELAYFRGMSHSQIAAHVGAPLGTVKTRIRLGMEHLRSALGADSEAP
jgi:RNA polymerase sigma-70 factor (ECF subfamily)